MRRPEGEETDTEGYPASIDTFVYIVSEADSVRHGIRHESALYCARNIEVALGKWNLKQSIMRLFFGGDIRNNLLAFPFGHFDWAMPVL